MKRPLITLIAAFALSGISLVADARPAHVTLIVMADPVETGSADANFTSTAKPVLPRAVYHWACAAQPNPTHQFIQKLNFRRRDDARHLQGQAFGWHWGNMPK